MLKRVGILILAVVFIGSMAWIPVVDVAQAVAKCACEKNCKCEHCVTGKGECHCKAGEKGCSCGKGCGCEHCRTGKGECKCHAGAADVKAKPISDADYAKTMQSKDGSFKATYTSDPDTIPVNKIISWKLKVETADGQAVKDAEISVNGDMPEHGHGLPTEPKVTKNFGDGTYLVEGIKFSMPGWWTMTFTIKSGAKTDSVTFNLKLT